MNNLAATFDELVSEYYRIWFRYHPLAAVYASVPGYEGLLTADADDEIGALSSLIGNLLVGLKELDFDALDPDRQLDLQLVYGSALVEHRMLLEQDWRYRDPARYLPLQQLQEVVIRQPERLCDALMGVMEKTPNYLRDARGRLMEMPGLVSTLWLADALETLERGIPWLKRLDHEMPQGRECCADKGRMKSLCTQSVEALSDFQQQLINELVPIASGSAECGVELLDWLLRHRDQMAIDAEQAMEYVHGRGEQISAKLESLGGIDTILARISSEPRLVGDERIQAYRDEAHKLKQFLQQEALLPDPGQPLEFRVTDNCFKQPDCGSYLRTDTGGIFLIPHDDQVGGGETLSEIRMRNLYGSWAGRHYLAWAGGVSAHSLVRQINPSAAFKRGWAHYFSRILEARGYFDEKDRALLELRRKILVEQATIDLEFHTGRIDSQQALQRLKALSSVPCWAEVSLTAISRRPTDAFMALLGADLLERLIQQQQQQYPDRSLLALHEALLAHGAVALPLVVQRACGQEIWESSLKSVLGA
ncbi:MAG: DUF885 family protein [Candidatus Thiodiazotropha sp.]